MRQGNDTGTQYRSAIYTLSPSNARRRRPRATATRTADGGRLGRITTEIADAPPFYYAEDYHQQYLQRIPAAIAASAGPE